MRSATSKPGPVFLPPNPVWRSYAGGRVLRQFRSAGDTLDDHFPEDWLASTVIARNGAHSQAPNEGLSRLGKPFAGQLLAESLRRQPEFWFGDDAAFRQAPGVLWKLLDSSVRLQFQAHPDRQFAQRHLRSDAGKTECWYILGARGDACVYLGFQRPPTPDDWGQMIREQRVDEMLACFDRIPVRPGECYVVPAGTPHAIGAGVFMVELMEPTDWVVRCETVNTGVTLTPEACFMGLELELCLDIFDYRSFSAAEVKESFGQTARTVQRTASFIEEEIISPSWHEVFRLHRFCGYGQAGWAGNEMLLLIATKGHGRLGTGGEFQPVQAGQTWLLPGAAHEWDWEGEAAEWEFLLAKLPASVSPAGAALTTRETAA